MAERSGAEKWGWVEGNCRVAESVASFWSPARRRQGLLFCSLLLPTFFLPEAGRSAEKWGQKKWGGETVLFACRQISGVVVKSRRCERSRQGSSPCSIFSAPIFLPASLFCPRVRCRRRRGRIALGRVWIASRRGVGGVRRGLWRGLFARSSGSRVCRRPW